MSQIKYVSVHERDDGVRRIKPGKGEPNHSTIRMPSPENSLEDMQRNDWERIATFQLPEPMAKSSFKDWWNDNLRTDDEPEVIDDVLRKMGERGND
jgi:hypothetical protein